MSRQGTLLRLRTAFLQHQHQRLSIQKILVLQNVIHQPPFNKSSQFSRHFCSFPVTPSDTRTHLQIAPIESLESETHYFLNSDGLSKNMGDVTKLMRSQAAFVPGSFVSRNHPQKDTDDSMDRLDLLLKLFNKANENLEKSLKPVTAPVNQMEESDVEDDHDNDEMDEILISEDDIDDHDLLNELDDKDLTIDANLEDELEKFDLSFTNDDNLTLSQAQNYLKLQQDDRIPTTDMYDVVLDCLAVSSSSQNDAIDAITGVKQVLEQLNSQYETLKKANDVLTKHYESSHVSIFERPLLEVEPYKPSSLSYNALIRTVALTAPIVNKAKNNDLDRDTALNAAFYTFSDFYHEGHSKRNTATYKYMFQIIKEFIPPSRSQGNIARGIFEMACEESVVDQSLLDELIDIQGGRDWEEWTRTVAVNDIKQTPQRWRMKAKKYRYRHGAGMY